MGKQGEAEAMPTAAAGALTDRDAEGMRHQPHWCGCSTRYPHTICWLRN